jgi:hypothetical protein
MLKFNTEALRLVFSNKIYASVAVSIFVALLIPLSILAGFIFLEPILVWEIQKGDITGFSLIVIVSALSGIVGSMSVFRIRMLNAKKLNASIAGPIIGASAGACSCGPAGFAIVSTFGSAGGIATAFLTNYEIPLRLISIGILIITLYFTSRGITSQCKIQ